MLRHILVHAMKIFTPIKGLDPHSDIIVSMKTHRGRFEIAHLAVVSLLRQSLAPKELLLYVSTEDFPNRESDLTLDLLSLRAYGLRIIFLDRDNGPYDKLIHTYRTYTDSRLVTVDDDLIYPTWFLERLVAKADERDDRIVCYRARHMRKLDAEKFVTYEEWEFATKDTPTSNIFPTNGAGSLFPPGSLHEDVFDMDMAHKLAPLADDIWYKAMALRKGTESCMVLENSTMFPEIEGTKPGSLWTNHNRKHNDEKLHRVFRHYSLFEMIP